MIDRHDNAEGAIKYTEQEKVVIRDAFNAARADDRGIALIASG
jgi:hypothetical protein